MAKPTPMPVYIPLKQMIGEKKNYNLVNYTQYGIGTIE